MSGYCGGIPAGSGFVSSTTSYIDCQAQALGSGAWAALAAPGSTLGIVLTGFLTIFIALIGYNLLFGRTFTVREGTLAAVKIGAVFALAMSWPAYRTLVYDLIVDGPNQIVAEIGPRAGVVGSDGTLLQRLDGVDQALGQLAILGPGNLAASEVDVAPPPFAGFDAFALGGGKILFLLTAIAGLASVRLVSGLMLALGPFFIAFLMFDSTRSLFEGWIRVLAGAALAAIGVAIALGLELALLEPWLSGVLARRMAGEALPTLSTELFVISCFFAILVLVALLGCARVARGFRLAPLLGAGPVPGVRSTGTIAHVPAGRERRTASDEPGRAAAVASILAASSRRDRGDIAPNTSGAVAAMGRGDDRGVSSSPGERAQVPVGHSFRRRSSSRVSAIAGRRDARA